MDYLHVQADSPWYNYNITTCSNIPKHLFCNYSDPKLIKSRPKLCFFLYGPFFVVNSLFIVAAPIDCMTASAVPERGQGVRPHKATQPAFNVGPSSAGQRNAIYAFRWRADDGPFIVIFGSSIPSSTKKNRYQRTPSDKTSWIRACGLSFVVQY